MLLREKAACERPDTVGTTLTQNLPGVCKLQVHAMHLGSEVHLMHLGVPQTRQTRASGPVMQPILPFAVMMWGTHCQNSLPLLLPVTTSFSPVHASSPVLTPMLARSPLIPVTLWPAVRSRRWSRVHRHRTTHPVRLRPWPHRVRRGVRGHATRCHTRGDHHHTWPHLAHGHLATWPTLTGWCGNHHCPTHSTWPSHDLAHGWARWVAGWHHGWQQLHGAVRADGGHLRRHHAWGHLHAAHWRLRGLLGP